MKTRLFVVCVILGVVWFSVPTAETAPSLPVTKPPVQPVLLLTGPPGDPTAAQGQWFIDLTTGEESVRPHEFYDEPQGGPMGSMAIHGFVDNITYSAGPGSPITAFSILATIHNDTSLDAQSQRGDNSHGESLAHLELPYAGPLVDTKLTAEFAIVDLNTLPMVFQPPYRITEPFIEAVNEDQAGWYCWSPEDPNPEHQPPGGYFVPTWDFGTIPLMQSASRQLQFIVNAPFLQPLDPRYVAIETSFATQADILLNRSTSLKISTWIDNIDLDLGVGQEEFPLRGSDVSVFHRLEIEEQEADFGDAPEGALAYPSTGVQGAFPTCMTVGGPGSWIQHAAGTARFGAGWDAEMDGNAGFCPLFNPNTYNQDECFMDGDAGLIVPDAFTVVGPVGSETVQPCPGATGLSLGAPCDMAMWGVNVDIMINNNLATQAYVNVLMDWNQDGLWSGVSAGCPGGPAPEHVLINFPVPIGAGTLSAMAPPPFQIGPQGGYVWTRFTITDQPVPLPWNGAGSFDVGETEDYLLHVLELDYGDAYDGGGSGIGHPTLLIQDGARHVVVPGVYLGSAVDTEPDGQPTINADGDDQNLLFPGVPFPPGDEDGVLLPPLFIAGSTVTVQVVASVDGYLNTWIDWNLNSSWLDPGEHVFVDLPIVAGINNLNVVVPLPPAAVWGGPYARWRFTTYAPTAQLPTGLEWDGEVEDYEILVEVLDFGDAPAPYPTLLSQNGARHRMPSDYWLGPQPPDAEPDGQPHPQALGDDSAGAPDEDGVIPGGPMIRGTNVILMIQASTNSGYLNAWVDFDQNGSWLDPGEQICSDLLLGSGLNMITAAVPATAELGQTFGRFRYSSLKGLAPTGYAPNGEVEDHALTIHQREPTLPLVITNLVHTATTDDMTVEWAGQAAVTYEAEYTTMDLAATNIAWTPWGGYVTNAPYRQTDTIPAETTKFYRVIAPYAVP